MGNKKTEKDYVWVLCLIIGIMCFWVAYLASYPDGRWHTAFKIWGAFWIGIAVLAAVIDWLFDKFRNL
jgi:hypothetical protein